ncbi:MAG: hypothetical protein E6I81_04225 [Chloroflexi bacterium]|nr:MAG: hypothetical protein AUI15_08570 [Actinobacteria bacterium 13_2_20CM_2_66_6]TMD35702.1 MAG: hypothetical protein E6I89_13835 [Chloroflexota bacterium]TMD73478.1 MAG: hypothetical protein E6I81_04225 [Chloroflexota bacterium]
MEVLRPKELDMHPGDEIVTWAREQLSIAGSILDNPGGGLLFATQTIGQVGAALQERDNARWREVIQALERAEDAAVRREFTTSRRLIDEAGARLR